MDPTRWPLARSPATMKALIGLLIATILVVGYGCAKEDWIDRTLVTVDVTGVWERAESSTIRLELKQQGPNVGGYLQVSGPGGSLFSGTIEGSVAGDTFRFKLVNGSVEGEMTVSGEQMAGRITGLYAQVGGPRYTLNRINPSAMSGSPPR